MHSFYISRSFLLIIYFSNFCFSLGEVVVSFLTIVLIPLVARLTLRHSICNVQYLLKSSRVFPNHLLFPASFIFFWAQ